MCKIRNYITINIPKEQIIYHLKIKDIYFNYFSSFTLKNFASPLFLFLGILIIVNFIFSIILFDMRNKKNIYLSIP